MGIRQLQTFIQKNVPNGYIDVSLLNECEQFSRENETRPILLIDLHGLLRPLVTDQYEIFCGIRHNVVYEKLDKFLKKLSEIAEVMFFTGSVSKVKLPGLMERQNIEYKRSQGLMEKINRKCPLKEIISNDEELISPNSHLKVVTKVASIYGTLVYAMDKERDTEIAKFAFENSNVLAILGDNSDFLIYPGNWKCFSLRDLNQETLKTKEYNRTALRQTLKLNDKELVILSTLNGNDVISYYDTFRFHKSLFINQRNDPALRFPAIAQYIKDRHLLMSSNIHSLLAYSIYRSNNDYYVEKVKESFEFYDIDFKVSKLADPTEKFLRDNNFNFAFMILKDIPQIFNLNFFDTKRSDNYFESINNMFSKHIGIILNDKPIQSYKIVSKKSYNDPEYTLFKVNKIIPRFAIPSLIELFDRSQHPEHDKTRFNLLKWLISDEKLGDVDLESIPIDILADILALTFMVNEGFADVKEADIVLLSIKQVQDKVLPKNFKAPEILHPRAFVISILFAKCHFYVTRCLENSGLKKLKKVINFDGVLFHNLFHKHINEPFNTSKLLVDLAQYRYYA